MNVAFLLSDAPGFTENFLKLGSELGKSGFNVYYFSDSETVSHSYVSLGGDSNYLMCFSKYIRGPACCDSRKFTINKGKFADLERLRLYYNASQLSIDKFFENSDCLNTFFEQWISQNNIGVLISETVAGSYTYAAFQSAIKSDILFLGYELSRINGLTELYFNGEARNLNLPKEELDSVRSFVEKYMNLIGADIPQTPSYMQSNSLFNVSNTSFYQRLTNKKRIMQIIVNLYYTILNKKNYFGYNPSVKDLIHLKLLLRRKFLKYLSPIMKKKSYSNKSGKIDIIFPLHFHPEAATSMTSQENFNELDILTYLCSLLPSNFKIYIKEHPSMLGRRDRKEKNEFKRLPNSVFIHGDENLNDKENIQAVITLTGTMGLEYALRGKRVITFGNVFYNTHPNVERVISKAECLEKLMREINPDSCFASTKENYDWLYSYGEKCLPVSFEASSCTDVELLNFAKSLIYVLNEETK
ncbi:hypothetical protein OAI56_00545 [Amylibacter sp.]|nr:hypothetical protein [Amylibacter sp.]